MKKLLLLFLLVPFIGSSQTTKPMYAYNVYMGNLDSAKIFGSNNNITYNFWGIDLIKKAVKYTDSAFMLSGYARSGISYTKAQSDAKYQLSGSYLTASDLSPYLLSATAASTYQAAGSYVPTARTITINGTTLDLTANRSFTIATNVGSVAWGSITGTLSGQTDLQTALNAKQNTITTGTTGQYFRGDLSLATFPAIPAAIDTSGLGARVTANTNATNANVASNTTTIALKVNIADFIVGVTPSGSINSSNLIFTLPNTPVTGKEILYLNGIRQKRTTDYTISGATVTFISAPITGDELLADYLK